MFLYSLNSLLGFGSLKKLVTQIITPRTFLWFSIGPFYFGVSSSMAVCAAKFSGLNDK